MSAFNSKSILKRVRIYIQLIRNTLEAKSVKSHILLGKYVFIISPSEVFVPTINLYLVDIQFGVK
jgi:hypothetical protein